VNKKKINTVTGNSVIILCALVIIFFFK